jgi:transcriptional regulator with GAF, ATPase, and Fis domain
MAAEKGLLDMDIPDEGINFEEMERELLKKAMLKSNNVAAKAARLLGMSYKTFWYRLEKFGINAHSPKEE